MIFPFTDIRKYTKYSLSAFKICVFWIYFWYNLTKKINNRYKNYIFSSAHILFDDAFELNDDEEMVPNSFVKLFASLINEAARCVYLVDSLCIIHLN